MKLSCWDHFFEDITEIQPYWQVEGNTPCITAHVEFSTPGTFSVYFDENKQARFKMGSFVNITLKSALLEITDAKNQYGSIPK